MSHRHGFVLASRKQARGRFALSALLTISSAATLTTEAFSQGPQAQAPAFADPSFRDKVWEAGGPKINSTKTGKLILGVVINGEQAVSEHKILSHMQSRPNRYFDSDQFTRDLHELLSTELFKKIEPYFSETPDGIYLRLDVVENQTVRSVVYHGNTRLDDSQLKKQAGLEIGDPINAATAKQAESRLLDFYRDKGFSNADIRLQQGLKASDNDIVFRISEGELERIDKINFVGNKEFASDVLKTKIKLKDARRGLTQWLFNAADRTKMHEDQQALERYYRRLGYFDAKVHHFHEYDDSGKWINLTFVIDEGKRYHINEISVRGNQYHTDEELLKGVTLKSNDPFNQDKMEKDAKLIREIYGAQGFIFCDVTPTPIYLPGERLNLVFEITEGDVYRASDINVHIGGDNSYTKERVALSMIGNLRPGRIIDSREVEGAERRLQFSQIFETNPQLGEPPRIDIQPFSETEGKAR